MLFLAPFIVLVIPSPSKTSDILPIAITPYSLSFNSFKILFCGGLTAKSLRSLVNLNFPGFPLNGLAITLATFHSSFKVIFLIFSQ